MGYRENRFADFDFSRCSTGQGLKEKSKLALDSFFFRFSSSPPPPPPPPPRFFLSSCNVQLEGSCRWKPGFYYHFALQGRRGVERSGGPIVFVFFTQSRSKPRIHFNHPSLVNKYEYKKKNPPSSTSLDNYNILIESSSFHFEKTRKERGKQIVTGFSFPFPRYQLRDRPMNLKKNTPAQRNPYIRLESISSPRKHQRGNVPPPPLKNPPTLTSSSEMPSTIYLVFPVFSPLYSLMLVFHPVEFQVRLDKVYRIDELRVLVEFEGGTIGVRLVLR